MQMSTDGDGRGPSSAIRESIFYRIGAFSYRRRRRVLLVWVVVLFAAFPAVKSLSNNLSEALKHDPDVEAAVARAARGSGIQTLLTGDAPFYKAFSDTTTHDLSHAETIAFPITLLILILAFGSLIAAGIPLAMAVFGLLISFGIISLVAEHATVSIFTENTMSMLGLGVGIDYSLFVVSRFRERLRAGRSTEVAIAEATASSGKGGFVSALTVGLALS